jgi:hypothetical protein
VCPAKVKNELYPEKEGLMVLNNRDEMPIALKASK